MSLLFKLGDDAFVSFLSWLDIGSICSLDTAVGNRDERLMWLHSLHSIDSKAIDEYKHCHSSLFPTAVSRLHMLPTSSQLNKLTNASSPNLNKRDILR